MSHALALAFMLGVMAETAITAPDASCNHLPRVTAAAAEPNDNRVPAGVLRAGVLTLRLVARPAAWYPEGLDGCALLVHGFAEEGAAPRIPGPLIRVRVGTVVRATVRNALRDTIWVYGLQDRDTPGAAGTVDRLSAVIERAGAATDIRPISLTPIAIAPGASHEFRFTATMPGTFYYWGSRREGERLPSDEDGQLVGGLVVDAPNAESDDRVFVLTRWTRELGGDERPFELNAMNGLSWPHTERLSLVTGEPVRWRVINASDFFHMMHLHGFYFRVLAVGDATRNDGLRFTPDTDLVVTESMAPGWTLHLDWTPERPGNWIFHCHLSRHMSAAQRLDRLPGAEATTAPGHGGHAEHDMAGLVLGITVHPAPGSAPAADDARSRRLRLFAHARGAVFGTQPGYGFVLQDGEATPAPDSIRLPGAPILLTRGEPVEITVLNRLAQPLAVHWHGLELESYFDGVAGWSGQSGSIAPAIAPGDSFVVRLTPPRAGTFIYHVHNEHGEELASGLYGALLVLDPDRPHDPERDLVFVVADPGPSEVRSEGAAPFINGTASPAPIELIQGEVYRFRFIHITANTAQVVALRGPGEVEWRGLARDGADYAPALAKLYPARYSTGAGATFDFEFAPAVTGEYVLTVATLAPDGQPTGTTVVPIRVRERGREGS
jgi:manganese oxidase